MTKILSYIGIAVLAIIAVVLGYTIFQQQSVPSSNNQSYITPPPSTNNSTATTPTTNQPSSEEMAILNFPGENATQAEIDEWNKLVDSSAQKVPRVNITNCKPQPLVLGTTPDTSFTVRNNDSVDHKIKYADKEYTISANGEKGFVVKRDFKDELGIIGYDCDGKLAGIIAVRK